MKYKLLMLLVLLGACGRRGPKGDTGATGAAGLNGTNGTSAVIEVISPCADNQNYREILLRLSNNQIIAVYDGGPHQDRLVLVPYPQTYTTTDGFSCTFSLDANGQLVD